MKKSRNKPLDFVIDKLTNSVENTSTGEVFNTEIVRLTLKDLKQIHKAEWQFDWIKEIKDILKKFINSRQLTIQQSFKDLSVLRTSKTIFSCTSLRVQNSIRTKTKFIKVFLEILLLMLVKYLLIKDIRVSLHLMPKQP